MFGTYRVLHQVGSGVLGPVFRTHDPDQDRLVAVKAITLDLVPEDVTRLADDLRALAALNLQHPNIVSIISAGLENGRAFIATDYVTGESLDLALRHLAPASLASAMELLAEIARAIDAAWAAGIGHGALHPRDILVTPGELTVCVTGFGIAAALERVGVKRSIRRPYTAPERIDGGAWDIRADVYSLAAIAQELLGGRRSGPAADSDPLPAVVPEDRQRVREVLAVGLDAEPHRRFGSASGFVAALSATVADRAPVRPATVTMPPQPPQPPVPTAIAPLPIDQSATELDALVPAAPDLAAELPIQRAGVVPAAASQTSERLRVRMRGELPPPQPAHAPFPWLAVVSVAVAALTLGGVGGFAIGRRNPVPVDAPAAVAQPATDTDVDVAPDPLPPAPLPDVRPAGRVSAGPGRLVVRSMPAGALVTVDGRHAGDTPTTVSDLPLGAHTVVIARPGYVPRTERVTLSTRDPARQLTVQLAPGVEAREPAVGSIYVDSRPRGARVLLDGRFVGVTPLGLPEIATGEHRVHVELDGHQPQASTVTVRPGEQARIALSLGREDRR